MRVSLAVIPLMLPIFSTDSSRSSLAVGPEGRQNVERSRYDVCLRKVGDALQLLQDSRESTSNLQQGEGQRAVAVCFVGTVGDALEGDGCLSVRDAWEASDLFHGAVGLARLVGA